MTYHVYDLVKNAYFFNKKYTSLKKEVIYFEEEQFTAGRYRNIFYKMLQAARLDKNNVFLSVDSQITEFAATERHRNDYFLFLSDIYLEMFSDKEVAGVIAHELGHIESNRFIFYRMLEELVKIAWSAVVLSIAFVAVSGNVSVFHVLFFFCAFMCLSLVYFKVHRMEEYRADAYAAELCGDSDCLVDVFKRLVTILEAEDFSLQNNSWFAQTVVELFSIHPSIEKRINALQKR